MTTRATLDRSIIGSQGPHKLILGHTLTGQTTRPLTWHRDYQPHALIAGATRSGKGGTIRTMQCHDIRTGSELHVIAPALGEFQWLRNRATLTNTNDTTATLNLLRQTVDTMHTRVTHLEREGLDKAQDLPNPWPWIVLDIDETPALLGERALLTYTPQQLTEASNLVAAIVERGAKALISLRAITQYPALETMFGRNPLGSGIRSNLYARIHCDAKPTSWHMMFDAGEPIPDGVRAEQRSGIRGRVIYANLDPADGGVPRSGQIMWIPPHVAEAIAQEHQP